MSGPRDCSPVATASCPRCGRPAAYAMSGGQLKCLRHAIAHPPLVRRALLTALVIGSVLTAINQLDVIVNGGLTPRVGLKLGLTYLVPYCVTTWGALGNARR
jgi:hypothetical protein